MFWRMRASCCGEYCSDSGKRSSVCMYDAVRRNPSQPLSDGQLRPSRSDSAGEPACSRPAPLIDQSQDGHRLSLAARYRPDLSRGRRGISCRMTRIGSPAGDHRGQGQSAASAVAALCLMTVWAAGTASSAASPSSSSCSSSAVG